MYFKTFNNQSYINISVSFLLPLPYRSGWVSPSPSILLGYGRSFEWSKAESSCLLFAQQWEALGKKNVAWISSSAWHQIVTEYHVGQLCTVSGRLQYQSQWGLCSSHIRRMHELIEGWEFNLVAILEGFAEFPRGFKHFLHPSLLKDETL